MDTVRCTQCGASGLEEGFIEDSGQSSKGYARWVAGSLRRGLLGRARLMGLPRWRIRAFRCPGCSHLELFAAEAA
jgi:hypothetical protein